MKQNLVFHDLVYTEQRPKNFYTVPLHFFFFLLVSFNIGVKVVFLKKYSALFAYSIVLYFLLYFSKDIMQLRASACLSVILLSMS
jgi:hypothetical protein